MCLCTPWGGQAFRPVVRPTPGLSLLTPTKSRTPPPTKPAVDLLRDPEALASMGDEMKADVASKIERCVCVCCVRWYVLERKGFLEGVEMEIKLIRLNPLSLRPIAPPATTVLKQAAEWAGLAAADDRERDLGRRGRRRQEQLSEARSKG